MIDKVKKKEIMDSICRLNVSDEAKSVLDTLVILGVEGGETLKSIPNLLIVSAPGVGISSFAHVYSKIIDASGKYKVRGANTFLELDFPNTDRTVDYDDFFDSPRVVVETQNRFWGTFVISFGRYDGDDLMMNVMFERLISFMAENRENISFVFHVTPDFTKISELEHILGQVVDIKTVNLGAAQLEDMCDYFVSKMAKTGMSLNEYCVDVIRETLIAPSMDDEEFMGYRSMDILARRFCYELAADMIHHDEGHDEDMDKVVDDIVVRMMDNRTKGKRNKREIGFRI